MTDLYSAALTPQTRLDWLRLIRSEHVGPVTFYHLLWSATGNLERPSRKNSSWRFIAKMA